LPVLHRDIDVPSLIKGRLYADFRPGKYRQGLDALLKALDFDISSLPLLAGCIIKQKDIGLIYLLGKSAPVLETVTHLSDYSVKNRWIA
jgi:hypothetical protein